MSVQANSNNKNHLVGDYCVPIRGTLRDSTICNAWVERDNAMHYLKDRMPKEHTFNLVSYFSTTKASSHVIIESIAMLW